MPRRPKVSARTPSGSTICLYLNTGRSELSIVDEHDRPVAVEEAKRLWDSASLADWNLAFQRLVMLNWDYEAVKAYYARGGRA